MPRPASNPLSEHVRRLEEERTRIAREMAAAEKELRAKAKPARPKSAPDRKVRLNNNAATLDLPRPKDHRFLGGGPEPRGRRTARRTKPDARMAQVKFLFLCLLLAVILLFFWSRFPG